MELLDSWTLTDFTAAQATHPVYRKGSGPGVILIHELPGMTPEVIELGEEIVAAGFTVLMPHLFGTPGRAPGPRAFAQAVPQVCVSAEFTKLRTGVTTPIAGWLRALARDLHAELGGPGVGALGMCFTGGFALAMMVDDAVAAPVVAQPSAPFAVGRRRAADLNLSPEDLAVVRDRAARGCQVLGLRYTGDPSVGTRFETLTRELGEAFIRVEFPGRKHCTLTEHRQEEGVRRVLSFFAERLSG